MHIAPIFTEGRILFSLNHVEFGFLTIFSFEIQHLFLLKLESCFLTMLSLKISTFFHGRQYVVFYHVFKYSDNSRFANIFLFCSISLVDCLLYVIAQKKLSQIQTFDLYEDNFFWVTLLQIGLHLKYIFISIHFLLFFWLPGPFPSSCCYCCYCQTLVDEIRGTFEYNTK